MLTFELHLCAVPGDAFYLTSSSLTAVQVGLIPTSTVLTATPNPLVYGTTVTLTLSVTPRRQPALCNLTSMQFNGGDTILSAANLVNGTRSYRLPTFPSARYR